MKFSRKIVNGYLPKKSPSQMFDRVLNVFGHFLGLPLKRLRLNVSRYLFTGHANQKCVKTDLFILSNLLWEDLALYYRSKLLHETAVSSYLAISH